MTLMDAPITANAPVEKAMIGAALKVGMFLALLATIQPLELLL